MRRPARARRLQGKVGPRRARVQRMRVGRHLLVGAARQQRRLRHEDHQRGCALGPRLVVFVEQAQELRPGRSVTPCVEETPGLRIERRGRPACRLEQGEQVPFGDRLAGEGARRPPLQKQRIDWIFCSSRVGLGHRLAHPVQCCVQQHRARVGRGQSRNCAELMGYSRGLSRRAASDRRRAGRRCLPPARSPRPPS